jgi:predicted nucleic acid-binding protein
LTTLVLLDTNTYLRLAKRVRPAVGVQFGQKDYVLTILKAVEDEVHRNPRLKSRYPWFDDPEFADERMAKQVRLSADEKEEIEIVQGILRGTALQEAERFTSGGRSPPGDTDCWLLAFGQVREAIVVTDDLGMHELAQDFDIKIWHGYELLDKLRSAKVVDANLIRDIYEALERNGDLTKTWVEAKHKLFGRIFGPGK